MTNRLVLQFQYVAGMAIMFATDGNDQAGCRGGVILCTEVAYLH
uniref:Uncharacterized protein n=1 Tax=Anguilla anguilla TaxID=7936 RepID=A0A0E9PEF3_ANGAN